MKIIHIFHSGFIIRLDDTVLVFDSIDHDTDKYFSVEDNVYVFVSHSHSDHFSTCIFDWEKTNPGIQYFLGNDIKVKKIKHNYNFMDKYKTLKVDNLKIQSFGSTDSGISFLVNINGINVFHAGDLNWWHWKNDSIEEQKKEERDFKFEVDKLIGQQINIAFVPVDPRLDEYYYLSAKYFVQRVNPKILIPMHFGHDFYITEKIKDKLNSYDTKILEINRKGQEFNIDSKHII
ncbi:MBL fold metallo-hydrolase [Maledivibacter halophilus]|uniref:L-ascorbate metabolism protein UlaG, beta-lactamase superfamily n=1 Tax=Maledivibacter halophilus TaxID=36842 RepID=A0A1T5M7P3_9FIRM|nr:MBL fold metallo-hydrolase [Maledivibacter halophilus]SKC84165.1 L-ascorbate metabolism protein UlaG, beta-lactamase superfamily [Maledivibacter halophilus]